MGHWKLYINLDPIEWLLEDNNPSVQYITLTDILGKKETDNEVKRAKEKIMST